LQQPVHPRSEWRAMILVELLTLTAAWGASQYLSPASQACIYLQSQFKKLRRFKWFSITVECVGWDAYTHHQRQVDLMLVYAVKQTETVRQLSRKVCFIQKMRKLTNIFQYYYWLNGDKSSQELNNLNFICEIFRQAYSHVLHARRFGERMCLRRTLYTWTAEFFIIIIIIIIACHRQSINSSMTWPTLV